MREHPITKLHHRGTDPEAIKVAEEYGLLFDGMFDKYYEFTTGDNFDPTFRGITFIVENLSEVGVRLKEKLELFRLGQKNSVSLSKEGEFSSCVIRTSPRWDSMVRHLGYEPVNPSGAPSNIPTDIELIRESQKRLAKVQVLPERQLRDVQRAHLSLSRAIAEKVSHLPARSIKPAVIPPASDRVQTAGLYSQSKEEICISGEQLQSGRNTVDTTAHELAHHESKAEDGDPAHKAAMANVAAAIVQLTDSGQFDNILRKPEFRW